MILAVIFSKIIDKRKEEKDGKIQNKKEVYFMKRKQEIVISFIDFIENKIKEIEQYESNNNSKSLGEIKAESKAYLEQLANSPEYHEFISINEDEDLTSIVDEFIKTNATVWSKKVDLLNKLKENYGR